MKARVRLRETLTQGCLHRANSCSRPETPDGLSGGIAELIDNSIQAGSQPVTVFIDDGTKDDASPTILVSDDGMGMSEDMFTQRSGWPAAVSSRLIRILMRSYELPRATR